MKHTYCMTQAHHTVMDLLLSIIHDTRKWHYTSDADAGTHGVYRTLLLGSHLVVDVGQEALQLPGVLTLPSPWLLLVRLLLVGPLLGMLDAGKHIDLHVHHNYEGSLGPL